MARARKSRHEKLEKPVEGLPKVVEVPDKWVKTMGGRRVLVPTPLMVVSGKGKKPPRVADFEKSLL
jgi:hypothetical protein